MVAIQIAALTLLTHVAAKEPDIEKIHICQAKRVCWCIIALGMTEISWFRAMHTSDGKMYPFTCFRRASTLRLSCAC